MKSTHKTVTWEVRYGPALLKDRNLRSFIDEERASEFFKEVSKTMHADVWKVTRTEKIESVKLTK